MADLRELIERASQELHDQGLELKAAKEDLAQAKQAWQNAGVEEKAASGIIWQDAANREEAGREN